MKTNSLPKIMTLLVLVLVIANLGFLSFFFFRYQRTGNNSIHPDQGLDQFLIKELGLNEMQKKAYFKRKSLDLDSINLAKKMTREAKDRFFALLKIDSLDPEKINAMARDASEKEEMIDLLTYRHFKALRDILNEEQKKKFEKIVQMAIHLEGPSPGNREPQGGPPNQYRNPGGEQPPGGPPPERNSQGDPPPPIGGPPLP